MYLPWQVSKGNTPQVENNDVVMLEHITSAIGINA
jgi:hypothetical protein